MSGEVTTAATAAEESFAIHHRVLASLQAGREAVWGLAEAFYELDTRRGWSDLGYETLGDYLGDPEVAYSRNHYMRLVRLHKQLVVERGMKVDELQELDYTKVSVVMPALESGKVKTKEAIADAVTLSRSDLREKYVVPPPPKKELATTTSSDSGQVEEPTPGQTGPDGEALTVHGEVLPPTQEESDAEPRGRKEREAAQADETVGVLSTFEKATAYDRILEEADQLDCIAEFEVARDSGAMTPRVSRDSLDEVCRWVKGLSGD